MLADIAAVIADTGGGLLVLDRDWARVVRFHADGAFDRILAGREGEGPGEFQLAVDMEWARDGHYSVLDYEANRLSIFDAGDLVATHRLEGSPSLQHVVVGDTIALAGDQPAGSPIVELQTFSGNPVDAAPPLAPEDRAFGAPIGLTRTASGQLLVGSPRPGVWYAQRGEEWLRKGDPLFPDMEPPIEETTAPNQITVTPAQAESGRIAALGDTLVLQGFMRFERPFDWDSPPGRDEIEEFIAVYSASGSTRAVIQLPRGVRHACLQVSPQTSHVYLCSDDPFPQVIEYALIGQSTPR